MASLRDIRIRIRSIRNTQKITGAMKLVAASKLRRAQEAIIAARPYARELTDTLARVSRSVLDAEPGSDLVDSSVPPINPLLQVRPPKRLLLVVMTSDRGLCGAFNTSILRRAESYLSAAATEFEHIEIATIGRRGADFFRKRETDAFRDYPGLFHDLTFHHTTEIADEIASRFVAGEFDVVKLLYNEFRSAISQNVTLQTLLPIASDTLGGADMAADEPASPADSPDFHDASVSNESSTLAEYIFEPGAAGVLDVLAPRYVATLLWRALLESQASEHGARMSAMDSATKNAQELRDKLTLKYNRARQANITQELMEIVGGAEALSG